MNKTKKPSMATWPGLAAQSLLTLAALVLALTMTAPSFAQEDTVEDAGSVETSQGEDAGDNAPVAVGDEADPAEAPTDERSMADMEPDVSSEGAANDGAGTDLAADVPMQEMTGPIDVLVNPIYLPDQAELVYEPLLEYLREATGLDLRLATVRNFHRYWLEARRDSAAPLIIEDSHMAAWRMNNHGYTPLVTTERPVTFSLLASNASMEPTLDEFIGKRVSTLPSPSLGYLILTDWYDNPLQQPVVLSNATSWLDAVEIVFSMEADAAIVPRAIAEKYPNLITIATSEELPGVTLSAAPGVSQSVRQALIDAMIVLHDDSEHHAALFELDVDRFVAANPADYTALDRLLGNIFSL